MAEPLATQADVEARLGRTLTATEDDRVGSLLRDASAAFRRAAGNQLISAGTTTLRILRGGPSIHLSQYPVNEITSIADLDDVSIDFTWYGGNTVDIGGALCTPFVVTYTHGYAADSDALEPAVGVVCQMVCRALGSLPDASGVTQESLGAYAVSYGSAAGSGAFGMLDAEKLIAASYRRPRRPLSML